MQTDATSLSWTQLVLGFLATLLTGGGLHKIFNSWLNSKKLPAEIELTEAGADKTRAEARKAQAEADIHLHSRLERLYTQIDNMTGKFDGMRAERDEYKQRADLQTIELKLRDDQIKRMKGILDVKGIKLSDFDEPKQ